MITADQLVLHGIGDYIIQSNWMAINKTKSIIPAMTHGFVYSLPFISLHPSYLALFVIFFTHSIIDRYDLARYVIWVKNQMITPVPFHDPQWSICRATGYSPDVPHFLAVWLKIICDNLIHVIINGLALKYL